MHRTVNLNQILHLSARILGVTFLVYCFALSEFLVLPPISTADTVSTSVTVSNTPPSFSVTPAESTESIASSPVNVAATISFTATATDINNDNYYLALCKTNAISANGTSAPTCTGGNWCISSSTTTGNQASCTYTVTGTETESNDWYAFVCDAVSGGSCSSSSQGSGNSGSPFYVNHRPTFTSITSSAADPGGTISFTTVASDSDSADVADTVKLVVCGATGATAAGCTNPANDICSSSFTSSNPTCDYVLASPLLDGSYTYHAYLFDSHSLGASNNPFPTKSYSVNNLTPSVSNVALNSGSDVTLSEGTTTAVTVTGTISDTNTCSDITSTVASMYRSGIGYAACDTSGESNGNNCYPNVSCSVSGGSCGGAGDTSANYTCTISLQYFTDATTTGTQYPSENWLTTIKTTDNDNATHTQEVSAGIEVNTLIGLGVSSNISFGSINLGANTGATNQSTAVSATGNVGIDMEISGTNLTSGGNSIPVANQKYSTSSFTYTSGGTALSTTPVEIELNVPKTTSVASPSQASLYWGIAIPSDQAAGTYTGSNYFTALEAELVDW